MKRRCLLAVLTVVLIVCVTACKAPVTDEMSDPSAQSRMNSVENSIVEEESIPDAAASEESNTESAPEEGIIFPQKDAPAEVKLYVDAWHRSIGEWLKSREDAFAEHGLIVSIHEYNDAEASTVSDVAYVHANLLSGMIEQGQLADLDEYLPDLLHLDRSAEYEQALAYAREYQSDGQGKLFYLPLGAGKGDPVQTLLKNVPKIHWDLYREAGYPAVEDEYQLMDVMQHCLEIAPADENIIERRGIYMSTEIKEFADWYTWHGIDCSITNYLGEIDLWNDRIVYMLDDDSSFYQGLKWLNTIYQRGLSPIETGALTPHFERDSINEFGYAVLTLPSLYGSGPIYEPVLFEGQKMVIPSVDYGSVGIVLTNAGAQDNLAASLCLIDALADETFAASLEDAKYVMQEDRNVVGQVLFGMIPFISQWQLMTDDSNLPDWQEKYGQKDIYAAAKQMGLIKEGSLYENAGYYMGTPDEYADLLETIWDNVWTNAVFMIYAESDDEFDARWDSMKEFGELCEGRKLFEWACAELEKGCALRDSCAG